MQARRTGRLQLPDIAEHSSNIAVFQVLTPIKNILSSPGISEFFLDILFSDVIFSPII